MFRSDLLSIIRSLNTVFTATGICHTSYVDCLLARSGWNKQQILSKYSSVIVYLVGFYYTNISRCSVQWMSNN